MNGSIGSPNGLQPETSSLGTPRIIRRKLRLSLGSSSSDCSGCADGSFCSSSSPSTKNGRIPLGEIKIEDPNIQGRTPLFTDKENMPPSSYRPASVPCLSSTPAFLGFQEQSLQRETKKPMRARKNLYKQISSPMGRMSLMSPTPVESYRGLHSPCSDGYAVEDMEDPTVSNQLSMLISGGLPSPVRCKKFSGIVDHVVVRPTPTRPRPMSHQGDGVFWDSGLGEEKSLEIVGSSDMQRRGSLKRSPMSQVDMANHKRRCLPLPSDPTTSVSPSSGEESFIGDHSKPYALPLVKGRGSDLKLISPDTLCDLLKGKFSDEVDCYTVFDCRFPYEYEGGHIRGAKNIWTQDALMEHLFSEDPQHPLDGHRQVFIFHCEFSSKRGPNMCRFLRKTDRKKNGMSFPKLFYPELYLLDRGYSTFFAEHPEMCVPQSYCRMEDQKYSEELKSCQRRSKSWSGETRRQQYTSHRHNSQH